MQTICKSKWFVPLFSVAIGFGFLAVQWVGGHPGQGLASLAIMAALGVVFAAGGRSETIRGLRGDGRDERFRRIDVNATAAAGVAVIVALLVGAFVELARGDDGAPYDWLAAVGGLAYLVAIVVQRLRG
jgi:hypothetical protein